MQILQINNNVIFTGTYAMMNLNQNSIDQRMLS